MDFQLLTMYVFVVVVVSVQSQYTQNSKGDNQGCSEFEYEYKILEKLIQLESVNSFLLNRIEELEKVRKPQTVISAHVRLSKSIPLNYSERVMYGVEISNIGSAFDLKEGHFLAPTRGIYLIHEQMCLGHNKQWMDLNIIKDGAVIGRVYAGDTDYHSCGSVMLNVLLEKGNKVWVVREDGQSTGLNQDHGWNSFKAMFMKEL